MCFEGSFQIPVYVDFVRRLILNADAPVFLIADGHPVHRCKAIRKLAAESDDRLCLFFLPAYSPDLKPSPIRFSAFRLRYAASASSTPR
ncbi:transposase [Burkholderia sp. R-70199]|nr:transposase [Burkholderia sp. R-70006]MBK5065597.1 transposase [Burkholderia sp. R-70199]MBK5169788.1 transposase [Burkholderia sp. R-70211]MBK5185237.1 transposase [Burkholderia sp. R-69749]